MDKSATTAVCMDDEPRAALEQLDRLPDELRVPLVLRFQEGMTFAVDGGISVDGRLGGRIGDSVVVTANGIEYITEYPRKIITVNR